MHAQRNHAQWMTMSALYMDKYPVTNAQYKAYLDASKYTPRDSFNFLKNWNYDEDTKTYSVPAGYAKKPVTYLGLSEAKSYCQFMKKRLPYSYEWQYAAQGNTSYLYPWGNQQKMGYAFPKQESGRYAMTPCSVLKLWVNVTSFS